MHGLIGIGLDMLADCIWIGLTIIALLVLIMGFCLGFACAYDCSPAAKEERYWKRMHFRQLGSSKHALKAARNAALEEAAAHIQSLGSTVIAAYIRRQKTR